MRVILASGSPRRHELLQQAGVAHTRLPVAIDETWYTAERPTAYIERMVKQKAQTACHWLCPSAPQRHITHDTGSPLQSSPLLVLTADTIGVTCDEQVLTKPKDELDAIRMWQQLSDDTHQVWTAVQATLVWPQYNTATAGSGLVLSKECWQPLWHQRIIQRTEVSFVALTEAQMQRYWQSGEPKDKAGAYAIQGGAAAWVSHINGSYTNVVGLPLAQTLALINRAQSHVSTYVVR